MQFFKLLFFKLQFFFQIWHWHKAVVFLSCEEMNQEWVTQTSRIKHYWQLLNISGPRRRRYKNFEGISKLLWNTYEAIECQWAGDRCRNYRGVLESYRCIQMSLRWPCLKLFVTLCFFHNLSPHHESSGLQSQMLFAAAASACCHKPEDNGCRKQCC